MNTNDSEIVLEKRSDMVRLNVNPDASQKLKLVNWGL